VAYWAIRCVRAFRFYPYHVIPSHLSVILTLRGFICLPLSISIHLLCWGNQKPRLPCPLFSFHLCCLVLRWCFYCGKLLTAYCMASSSLPLYIVFFLFVSLVRI